MLKSSLSDVLSSFSYSNIIINGNFANTDNWTPLNSSISASENVLSILGTGTNATTTALQNTSIPVVVGNKIFVMATARVTNENCNSLNLSIRGTTSGSLDATAQLSPVQSKDYKLYGIVQINGTYAGNIRVRLNSVYADAPTANNKVTQLEEVFCVDLTEKYGAGNEPSAADCANIFKFTDGTKQPNLSKSLAA